MGDGTVTVVNLIEVEEVTVVLSGFVVNVVVVVMSMTVVDIVGRMILVVLH